MRDGCTDDTPATDYLYIHGQGGDDIIAPVVQGNIGLDLNAQECLRGGWDYQLIAPYRPAASAGAGADYFDFSWVVYGGSGRDIIHGSHKNDWLYSAHWSSTSDNAADFVCGHAGNDRIYGDNSGDSSSGRQQRQQQWRQHRTRSRETHPPSLSARCRRALIMRCEGRDSRKTSVSFYDATNCLGGR